MWKLRSKAISQVLGLMEESLPRPQTQGEEKQGALLANFNYQCVEELLNIYIAQGA